MTIEIHKSGSITYEGSSVDTFRLKVLVSSLKLELKTGLKMSHGKSAFTIAKKEYGVKGTKQEICDTMEQKLREVISKETIIKV